MMTCRVATCNKPRYYSNGLCGMHYQRIWRTGTLDAKVKRLSPFVPIEERLAFHIEKDGITGCWNWTGYVKATGYGQININGKIRMAHRVAWEIRNGPIPQHLCVLHQCDNPKCINPSHLFLGTHTDNMRDCLAKGRRQMPNGEHHAAAKLDAESVLKIRELRRQAVPRSIVASQFQIHPGYVTDITSGRSWKHLPC